MITTTIDARIYNEMQSYCLTAEERLVFLTLMLSPERSLIGIHKIDIDILKARTKLSAAKINSALCHLKESKLLTGDYPFGEIYTPSMLKSNGLKDGKTYKVYLDDLRRVGETKLVEFMVMDFGSTAPATFVAALIDAGYTELLHLCKEYDNERLDQARKAYVKQKEN